MEFIHQLFHHIEPILLEFLIASEPLSQLASSIPGNDVLLVGVIQFRISGIVAVIRHTLIRSVIVAALVGDPPAEGSAQMLGQAKGHVVLIRSRFPQSADVLLGTDLHGIEAVDFRIVVEEVVVVHSLGHKVTGASAVIQIHQFFGLEIFRFPQLADVLIAKLGRMAVMADMIQVLGAALDVHVPGIPVTEHGYALGAPVAPNAKFHIAEPIRALIGSQRIKCCFKPLAHNANTSFC